MKANKVNHDNKPQNTNETSSLKGTLFSVLMVGGVIALMWIGIFWLYMDRV